jgi:NADH-quinone oxidoreductase subunit J
MTVDQAFFYFFAAILVGAAVCVVTARNPVHAALFLVLAFVTSAVLWIWMQAEFLGIILVLVYAGAVMVLFLFVLMMLDLKVPGLRTGLSRFRSVGALVAGIILVELFIVIRAAPFATGPAERLPADHSNTQALGTLLYTHYVYPFEIAAAILLVAIVAAIVLALRRRPPGRRQDPAKQVKVKKAERVRLVRDNPGDRPSQGAGASQ